MPPYATATPSLNGLSPGEANQPISSDQASLSNSYLLSKPLQFDKPNHVYQSARFKVIAAAVQALIEEKVELEQVPFHLIEAVPPKDKAHGDVATNAAMVLSKAARLPPLSLAEKIVAQLKKDPFISEAAAVKPGFINLNLRDHVWFAELATIIQLGTFYGSSQLGAGKTVNIEFVSANPTGPLHTAHARGAVVGDALALMMQHLGYKVVREYYINDAGAQVDVLARSLYWRYREALGEVVSIPAGLYPGEYLKPTGQKMADRFGKKWLNQPESAWLVLFRQEAVAMMMQQIREDLQALGVRMDVFSSERALLESGAVEQSLARLEEKDLIYYGVLEPPKGKKASPPLLESAEEVLQQPLEREQYLFRSTAFGDDMDRALKKADGSYTYFANDIAYHMDKLARGADRLIDVVGADHAGWVSRIRAAVKALSGGAVDLDVKLCALVNFLHEGQVVKMSKRQGTFVTLRDVLDEVGPDVLRFIMLTRRNDQPLDFDLVKVNEASRENPVFYVHYAHARCCSVLRLATEQFGAGLAATESLLAADVRFLSSEPEQAMIKTLARWPMVLENSCQSSEPHRVAYYLHEVAGSFHHLWTKGKEDTTLRFISADLEETKAKIFLVKAVSLVLATGLKLMGVTPREELRS